MEMKSWLALGVGLALGAVVKIVIVASVAGGIIYLCTREDSVQENKNNDK